MKIYLTLLLCIGLVVSSCNTEADKKEQAEENERRATDSIATAEKAQAETEIRIIKEKLKEIPKNPSNYEEYCEAKNTIAASAKYATVPLSQQFADTLIKESTKKLQKSLESVLLNVFNVERVSWQFVQQEVLKDYDYKISEVRWDSDQTKTKGESATIIRSCTIVLVDEGIFSDDFYKVRAKYVLKYSLDCNISSYLVQEEKAIIEPIGNVPMKRTKRLPSAWN